MRQLGAEPGSGPLEKLRLAFVALVLVIIGGTAGLMWLERMTPLEALYMVVITLSTVGFGEIRQLHDDSRILVMLIIVFGVVLGGFLVTVIGQFVLEGQFKEVVSRRKMNKQLRKLSDHYIVAGFGRVGRQVVSEFKKRGVPYVVLEKRPGAVEKLIAEGHAYIEGDATDEDILRQAKIERAHTLISTLPDEAHNVYLTLTARDMAADLNIIARADFEEGEKKLLRAGANHVVIPHVIGGVRMAMASLRPNVVDFMQIAAIGEEGLSLEELVIPTDSVLIGRTIMESGLKNDFGVTIIGVKHRGEKMILNPEPAEVFREGDIMILIGEVTQLEQLNKSLSL
jgi:voltage-gated potassium channel